MKSLENKLLDGVAQELEKQQKHTLSTLIGLASKIKMKLIESMGETDPEIDTDLMIVEANLPDKLDAYQNIILDIQGDIDTWKKRGEMTNRVVKTLESHIDRMKNNIKQACQSDNTTELKGNEWVWKLQRAKSRVIVENKNLIPSDYEKVVSEIIILKEQIKADIEKGIEVPGCKLEESTYVRAYPNMRKK